MNPLGWIEHELAALGFEISPALRVIVGRASQVQRPFYFLDKTESVEDTDEMNNMFPSHQVVAFARRRDFDGVVCVVVANCDYPKGSVLVLHWDGWPGAEVDEDYPSLAAWARSAEEEIAARLDARPDL